MLLTGCVLDSSVLAALLFVKSIFWPGALLLVLVAKLNCNGVRDTNKIKINLEKTNFKDYAPLYN